MRLDTHRGPKSPAKASIFLLAGGFFLIFNEHFTTKLNPYALPWRPEGSEPATGFGGANKLLAQPQPSMAKPSGPGPTSAHLNHHNPQRKKKSYICAPAAMLGIEAISPLRTQDTTSSSLTPNVIPPAKLRKNRLTGFCWNICSLSNYKFDILRQWMLSQHLDIMLLQDTRWGFSGDWSDNNIRLHP